MPFYSSIVFAFRTAISIQKKLSDLWGQAVDSLWYLHILCIVVIFSIVLVVCINRRAKKSISIWIALIASIGFFSLFLCIILVFQHIDPTIRPSDWLPFLGSYLGFAGSLVMSFLIYRQSVIIDEFTISEYKPSLGLTFIECIQGNFDEYNPRSIDQGYKDKHFYTFFCNCSTKELEKSQHDQLIFVTIQNYSKATIHNVQFKKIVFTTTDKNSTEFPCELDANWNKVNIFPDKSLNLCFLLCDCPNTFPLSQVEFILEYELKGAKKKPLVIHVLAVKEINEPIKIIHPF